MRLAIPRLSPHFSSFRAMRLSAAKNIATLNTPFTFVDGSLCWVTGKFGHVPVQAAERSFGSSGYDLLKLFRYTLNIITTFSDLPMRLISAAGMAAATAGFAYGGYLIVRELIYHDITPGYTSVMAVLLSLGGLILIAQGVNGEYIARINHKTSGRPRFVEREE
jgi:undecaprenyl-phosphate 4-deoxy-4-formamido-L-arabinose transferase